MPYLSASAVMIHYEEALYQVYATLPLPLLVLYGLRLMDLWFRVMVTVRVRIRFQ